MLWLKLVKGTPAKLTIAKDNPHNKNKCKADVIFSKIHILNEIKTYCLCILNVVPWNFIFFRSKVERSET